VELTRSCSSCLGPRAETVRASLIFVGDGIVTGKAGPPSTVPFALNAFIPAGSLQLGDFFYEREPPLLQKDTEVFHLLSALGELPIEIQSIESVFPSNLNCGVDEALVAMRAKMAWSPAIESRFLTGGFL